MFRTLKLGRGLLLALLALPAFSAEVAVLNNGFTIRHEGREIVGTMTRLYTDGNSSSYVDVPTASIDHFEPDLTPPPAPQLAPRAATSAMAPQSRPVAKLSPQDLNQVINNISELHKIDPDLINSVIHAESGFNQRAVSPKGAQGLMQLMPQTAGELGVTNSFDPTANVEGGTRYLRELLERYNFDIVKALAAYNAGPQRVEQYRGVPPYYETRVYIARIIRDFNKKKIAEQKAAAAAKAQKSKTSKTAKSTATKPTQTAQVTQAGSR